MDNFFSIIFFRIGVMLLAYFAYIESNIYCENLFIFISWGLFVVILLCFIAKNETEVKIKLRKIKRNEASTTITIIFYIAIITFLVTIGHLVLGIVWLLTLLLWKFIVD